MEPNTLKRSGLWPFLHKRPPQGQIPPSQSSWCWVRCLMQVCAGDPATAPASGSAHPSVSTGAVGKALDLFQGGELLFGAVGHAEGGGAEPAILSLQVAGVHEEHVSGKQGDRRGLPESRSSHWGSVWVLTNIHILSNVGRTKQTVSERPQQDLVCTRPRGSPTVSSSETTLFTNFPVQVRSGG